ncbi:MAG: RNA methyltransferase [Deltaproteobacteria bacterium]|nr:RNA methyltransferase [Deltaproteobacteria bacterium]
MGYNAVRAILVSRPSDIVRLYVHRDLVAALGPELGTLAEQRRPYHVVTDDDLDRLTQSVHHEGLAAIVRVRVPRQITEIDEGPACVLVLDGVANPHNIGAIVRSAAHFGASMVVTLGAQAVGQTPAALRTAEGGAEHVDVVAFEDFEVTFEALRSASFTILATAAEAERELWRTQLPERVALVLGAEGSGSRAEVRAAADGILRIPGTGWVESLNVSTAAAVMMAEWWRSRRFRESSQRPRRRDRRQS